MSKKTTSEVLDDIDALMDEVTDDLLNAGEQEDQEAWTPYASYDSDIGFDPAFLKTIELIRTKSNVMYGLSRSNVNPYQSWVDLLEFLQKSSMISYWYTEDVPEDQRDEIDENDVSLDYERYARLLEEITYQMLFDISMLARASLQYGNAINTHLQDDFTAELSGASLWKVIAAHYFGFKFDAAPLVSQSSSTYEIERIIRLFPHFSPQFQETVGEYMDKMLPKVYSSAPK